MGLLLFLLLLVVIVNTLIISEAQKLDFEFRGPFNTSSYYSRFSILGSANFSKEALELTPYQNPAEDSTTIANTSSRVFFNHSFKLWEEEEYEHGNSRKTSRLASFNTSFLLQIVSNNNNFSVAAGGEGFAFIIAPDISIPLNSHGQYLGLTNSTTDGDPSNGVVAIELDTVKQDFDPDDNHLGLDIHSVRSNKTVSFSNFSIHTAAAGDRAVSKFFMVWINYDGLSNVLDVYMVEQGKAKPGLPILTASLGLRGLVNRYSYFGFAASTHSGGSILLSRILEWNLTVYLGPLPTAGTHSNNKRAHWATGLIALLTGIGCLYCCWRKMPVIYLFVMIGRGNCRRYGPKDCGRHGRKQRTINLLYQKIINLLYFLGRKTLRIEDQIPIGIISEFSTREFNFKDLKRATNDFDPKNKLGEGGFGVVYKGVLPNEKLEVAVKTFSGDNLKDEQNFLHELTIIHSIHHRNIVPLLGWCNKNGRWFLVYEYMPNGSLDKHLFTGPEVKVTLHWKLRYSIIKEVASTLCYLHFDCRFPVIHRDIKPSNILLDSNFSAHLGDFGLACGAKSRDASFADVGMLGTFGYIAPEIFFTSKATCHSDVYSFGAVVLEIVCGQHIQTDIAGFHNLPDWVWWLHRQGCMLEAVDERLLHRNDYVTEEAERLLLLGLACSNPIASERPNMQDIVHIISGEIGVHVPPFKPVFVWPSAEGPYTDNSINIQIAAADSLPYMAPSEDVACKKRMFLMPAIFCIFATVRFKALRERRSQTCAQESQAAASISHRTTRCLNVDIKPDTARIAASAAL